MNDAPTVPELITRKPTGKPPWPMTVLAGGEKSGKSWAAAEFSASEMVGRTFFIELGEHYADEYGRIPGVRYEIVPHDGTYRDIGRKIWAATKQERVDGKPNAIIFDSVTLLWDMLSKQAQQTANRRWRGKNPNAPEPDDEIQVTVDLWNIAKGKFGDIINLLRQHDGPVILTARLEEVTVMAGGKPTDKKMWKVQAEKNLAFEVDAVIQARTPRVFEITGLRSTRFELPVGETIPMPGFTLDGFFRRLGLDEEGATAPRSVTLPQPDPQPDPKRDLAALISQKLGPDAYRNQHAVMSQRWQRRIGSFDDLKAVELATSIRELSARPDFVPPRNDARYEQLHQDLAAAPLEGIDALLQSAADTHAAGQITDDDLKQLNELAELRASALVADLAGERDWTPEAAGQPAGATA